MNRIWRAIKERQMRARDRKGLCPRCGEPMGPTKRMGMVGKTCCPACNWVKIDVTN
jgi:formylmethanofuran dehydrogenase subunit E